MIAASVPNVPVWSLAIAALAVYLTVRYHNTEGQNITAAGLAGGSKFGAIRRGQSALSVAQTAANAAIAMQAQVELQDTKIAALEATIVLLRKDNERLERLVTQTTWGESLARQITDNHAETLRAIAAIGAPK